MTFEEDLTKRRINVTAFAAGDPEKFAAWQLLYQQVHPNTFYTSVKMVINDVRRRFWLPEAPKQAAAAAAPTAAKPVVRRAPVPVPSTASAIPDEPSPSVDRTPEPAPAPRGRAVIRRPTPAFSSETPAEKDLTQVPAPDPANENTNPEAPKPGRARPVFRRPAAESEATASPESKNKTETNAPAAPDISSTIVEPPKPARPRPVFRKPSTPATNAAEGEATKSVPAEAEATSLPDHSNPDPTVPEIPKPLRPRPVFKRPATATTEPEKTNVTPENSEATISQPETAAEKLNEASADAIKPPRPRPVFKRPAAASTAQEPERKPEEIQPENAPEQTADKPKFPRPRPVIKPPVAAAESQTPEIPVTSSPTAENVAWVNAEPEDKNAKQYLTVKDTTPDVTPNSLEIKLEPDVPKTPRPRPIFKRLTKPDAPGNTTNNNPEQE